MKEERLDCDYDKWNIHGYSVTVTPLAAIFQLYHGDQLGKQLVNFITCGCESSTLFYNLQSRARTHVVLAIGLYMLLGNLTTRALTLFEVMTST